MEKLIADQPEDPRAAIITFLGEVMERENNDAQMVFSIFDRDGNGTIDKKELRKALRTLGFKDKKKYVKKLISEMDSDGDGVIDAREFLLNCPQILRDGIREALTDGDGQIVSMKERTESVHALSKALDFRGKGHISQRDLRQILFVSGIGEAKAMVRDIINAMEVDKYGEVHLFEFASHLNNGSRRALEAAIAAKGGVAVILGEMAQDPQTAALRLQSMHRGRKDRAAVKVKKREAESATKMQGLVRVKAAKKEAKKKKEKKDKKDKKKEEKKNKK